MNTESQKKMLLEHMRRGLTITRFEAMQIYGIANFTARVSELRQAGHPIDDVWVEKPGRNGDTIKFKRYRMNRKPGGRA